MNGGVCRHKGLAFPVEADAAGETPRGGIVLAAGAGRMLTEEIRSEGGGGGVDHFFGHVTATVGRPVGAGHETFGGSCGTIKEGGALAVVDGVGTTVEGIHQILSPFAGIGIVEEAGVEMVGAPGVVHGDKGVPSPAGLKEETAVVERTADDGVARCGIGKTIAEGRIGCRARHALVVIPGDGREAAQGIPYHFGAVQLVVAHLERLSFGGEEGLPGFVVVGT